MEQQMRVLMMVALAIIVGMMQAKRQPRWEPKERSGIGAAIHWFSLAKGNEAAISIRGLYFGTGEQFREAGYMMPNDSHERLCALVVAVSQITTVNARGESVWMTCMITQGIAGDLYLNAMKSLESKTMKWIVDADLMIAPNGETNLGDKGGFDSVEPLGECSVVIRHDEHPENPARSVYVLTDFKAE